MYPGHLQLIYEPPVIHCKRFKVLHTISGNFQQNGSQDIKQISTKEVFFQVIILGLNIQLEQILYLNEILMNVGNFMKS